MPEITALHIALLILTLGVGIVVGWMSRSKRCVQEKTAISAGWKERLSAQRSEHDRLGSQNKNLMEQISQYQSSSAAAKVHTTEMSATLKQALERRDELQNEIKDIRGNLEAAIEERDQLQMNMTSRGSNDRSLKDRDEKIFKLSRELESWQNRLPPLIERFSVRDKEALQLEADLAQAHERIYALQTMVGSDQTRVEPVDPDSMIDGMDASNDAQDAVVDELDRDHSASIADDSNDLVEATDDDENPGDVDDADENEDKDEDERIDSLLEDFQGTATNELLDDLEDADEVSDIPAEREPEEAEQAEEPPDFVASDGVNAGSRDNLKLIKGVGPSIEKTLNEMGISRFDQIADMSEYDIDRVARRLKGFHSRIYREDWIGQARDLQLRKENDRR